VPEYQYVSYELLDEGRIARVLLDRPEVRNAQNRGMLVELDDALLRAEADDEVRVVILGGAGPMFTSGHDIGSKVAMEEYGPGLMLMWACDLIVGSEEVRFADVVGTRLGMCGVEYFAHPWELGPRKTKELMLTGDAIDIHEAHRLGMVAKVFPRDELVERTLELARRIAQLPTMTALLIKESVNQTVDNMGFHNALHACFTLHQLNHSHWAGVRDDGYPVGDEAHGVPSWRDAPAVVLAVKDQVRADA